ncbi:MAG: vWA domain-containing protein [Burkholderiales bacterium]
MEIGDRLAAARVRLILDKPFLGALALRLPMVSVSWCKTTATDARNFYYNPEYIERLNLDQMQFVIAHEALHCALSHFERRGRRARSRWDIACDHAVNPVLAAEGLAPPPGTLILTVFEGMTAEEIYPLIDEESSEETMDQHLYGDEGSGKGDSSGNMPPPPSREELAALSEAWRQHLAQALQQADRLEGGLARMVGELLQPGLSWRALLSRHLAQFARDDYSYQRPSRREGDMILPSLRSIGADLVVALDTSGSVREEEMKEFLAEIDAIKGQLRARIILIACDANLSGNGPWYFEPWEEFRMPESFQGGGGTDFRPVFDWVERQEIRPDVLLYFTDAMGEFPGMEPSYPVIWLVKGSGGVPWGERVQLN